LVFQRKEYDVTQDQLNHEVASATGESVRTISDLGFVPLMPIPYERDREPLVVDWDELDSQREVLHPISVN
jgi:hypothetical protein